ncbi:MULTISPECIES: DUF2087 domain-containing protein [Rhodopseudomonas]|uniref:DUF2087 domain-containing protein n=1 Tax=Rhodopseudomonas palustris TaxID=1076 RepID=A0A0D7EW15_RHOPL|nr:MULTISPECIES: DUF2087 domain-containing protein [Rhodopseudomonas]KIZ44720.1 hypothetical protein OO17_09455 [Rhodopseudomonas palustris]MDF3813486.1 DUF2087 domain-containing protein [Rhodopseudomonas sp. BAL398]WOK18686.1 DUF2087 domain-containing protein [Rhodopseudomonas sp. BAL398]
MTRTVFPFAAQDVSALARALNRELEAAGSKLGHLQLLNLLARAVGQQNFQHFRAQFSAQDRLNAGPAMPDLVDHLRVERVARHFDPAGSLRRWPAKAGHQVLCLWSLWSRIPSAATLTEKQVNAILNAHHGFGDHALLRRALCDHRLLSRNPDGSAYRRIEGRPPPEALALIRHLAARHPG